MVNHTITTDTKQTMIYPDNFEKKIGFDEIKEKVTGYCLSTLGKDLVDEMTFSHDSDTINTWMEEIREMRQINEEDDFPLTFFFDVRDSLKRLRLQNTWIEEDALFDIRRSLKTMVLSCTSRHSRWYCHFSCHNPAD